MSQLATHSPFPLKKKNLCYSFPPRTPISHTKRLEKSQKKLRKSSEKAQKKFGKGNVHSSLSILPSNTNHPGTRTDLSTDILTNDLLMSASVDAIRLLLGPVVHPHHYIESILP